VVRGFLAAAGSARPGTWNLGTGAEVTVLDLVTIIAGIAGTPVTPRFAPARPGELLRSAVVADRAARDLGWRPVTGIAEGIGRVFRWMEAGTPVRAAC
jgi:UDP-glucose 4-epimerase